MNIDKTIGDNIRKYRMAYNMTLKELAEKMHKSISTVSKYEKGNISIDMPTFMELADIFNVSPSLLLTDDRAFSQREKPCSISPEILYMYSYNTQEKNIIQSIIERYPLLHQNNTCKVQLFNDVKDTKAPGNCGGFYTGECMKDGFIETYILHNQLSKSEYVMISCVGNLTNSSQRPGLVSGLSNYTMFPTSFKILISDTEIFNKEILIKSLQFSKEDFKLMKKTNTLSILNA